MKNHRFRIMKIMTVVMICSMVLAGCGAKSEPLETGGTHHTDETAEASTESEGSEDDELLKEMAGKYDCVEIRKDGREADTDGETLQMYEDYEALVTIEGTAERFKITTDRSGFVLKGELDGEKTEFSCTYRRGVIHMENDDAEYVFAKKDTDRWKEWDEARSGTGTDSSKDADSGKSASDQKSAKNADDGMAGYYTLSQVMFEEGTFTGEELTALGRDMYIVLDEDGTGWMAMVYSEDEVETLELEWDETAGTISSDGDPVSYTLVDGILTLEADGERMEFKKSDKPAPKKPASSSGGSGNAGLPEVPKTMVCVLNETYMDVTGSYFADTNATSWDTDHPDTNVLSYGETAYVNVDNIGGAGVYDILFIDDTDWKYTFYGVTLSGGETIIFSEVDIMGETCKLTVTDANGNKKSYDGQALLPE